MTFIAFNNSEFPPEALIAQLEAHYEADEIVQGLYWENGKGCAIGCALHSRDHREYERRGYAPLALAHLQDVIHEMLPLAEAKEWPLRFTRALASAKGRDISRVQWQFLHWLLTDETVNPGIRHPLVADVVERVAALMHTLADGEPVEREAAWTAARAAARATRAAGREAARTAALVAEWAAEAAAGAEAAGAEAAAESAAVRLQADKLVELLGDAGQRNRAGN